MDRPRRAHTGRIVFHRGFLVLAAPLLVCASGCGDLTGDFDRIVAIEISSNILTDVEEGDTVRLIARAIDASGDIVTEAQIFWAILDTGQVGFTVDSATGLVTGLFPGSGRVQGRVENLRSDPITVRVTAAPDSIAVFGNDTVTFAAGATVSPPLVVRLLDLTTDTTQQFGIDDKPVTYTLVNPQPGSPLAEALSLAPTASDTARAHQIAVATVANGQATAFLRLITGPTPPDTAIIEATAVTARGDTVPGSPVSLTVVITSN